MRVQVTGWSVIILSFSPPPLRGSNGTGAAAAVADAEVRHVEPLWLPPPGARVDRPHRVPSRYSSASVRRSTKVSCRLRNGLRRSELIEATSGRMRRGGVARAPRVPSGLSYMRSTVSARHVNATRGTTALGRIATAYIIPNGIITRIGRTTLNRMLATGFRAAEWPIGIGATLRTRHSGPSRPMTRITPATQPILWRPFEPM